jgi:hypothetical protein
MPAQVLLKLKFDLLLLPCASHPGNLQSLACTAVARKHFKSLLKDDAWYQFACCS